MSRANIIKIKKKILDSTISGIYISSHIQKEQNLSALGKQGANYKRQNQVPFFLHSSNVLSDEVSFSNK